MNDKSMLNERELEKVSGGENVTPDIPFRVKMINGPYIGKTGTVIELICTVPVNMYIVEFDHGFKDAAGLNPMINEDEFKRI